MTDESNTEVSDLDTWLIRPCDIYKFEYKNCTSMMSRLHQLFIYGKTIDCRQHHKDYLECCKWKSKHDTKAAEALIQSEINKRNERWKNHFANNIWENRTTPPENWNDPLPDYIADRKSSLNFDNFDYDEAANSKKCSIM
ncbi:UPF0545 protein C22orf39 homolog [Adelges cooleyi]|uniref:UPF0545 protein C22orf39 homolog n=1 Tax=Adelges cooleyi TaxID=133065 RepID=UPI00217F37D5|nr:UPF0545 protein C22orf39 homolog [Adelges cooleyi]